MFHKVSFYINRQTEFLLVLRCRDRCTLYVPWQDGISCTHLRPLEIGPNK